MNTPKPFNDDQLDGLLHSFFKSEKPREFRPCPKPWAERPTPAPERSRIPSRITTPRWAFAATAVVLLGGLWLTSSIGPAKAPATKIEGVDHSAKVPVEMKPKTPKIR
jgi:hypothetical protein